MALEPEKAEVGKLYQLQFVRVEDGPLFGQPEFYVFDSKGVQVNRTWKRRGEESSYCLVLGHTSIFTVVLVGEDIIHLANDDSVIEWHIYLLPLNSDMVGAHA